MQCRLDSSIAQVHKESEKQMKINLNFNAGFTVDLLIRYTMYEFHCSKEQAERHVLNYMNRSNDNE